MGRKSNNAKRFVVSCRVDNSEMEVLQNRAQEMGMSITTLLRRCLELPDQDPCHGNFSRA